MKKVTTKLTLSKETITKLNTENMSQLLGGHNSITRAGGAAAQETLVGTVVGFTGQRTLTGQ